MAEYPDREEPAGLAVLVPIHAVRLGHAGVVVSRVGQDPTATDLLARLAKLGVETSHVQSDPDLATGRLQMSSLRGKAPSGFEARAAFDNLQWDFDLEDLAQVADAVVLGAVATREGQARLVVNRFLSECHRAFRIFDLTKRAGDTLDRDNLRSTLQSTDAAVIDRPALEALLPAARDRSPRDAALELMHRDDLQFVVAANAGEPLTVHTDDRAWSGDQPHRADTHEAAVIGLVHGIMAGWNFPACLEVASRVSKHTVDHPDEPVPAHLLGGG